jgi:hypothetical protein
MDLSLPTHGASQRRDRRGDVGAAPTRRVDGPALAC